jgi:hypothetical protein
MDAAMITKPQMEYLKRAYRLRGGTMAIFSPSRPPAPLRRLLRRRMIERVIDERGYQHYRVTHIGEMHFEKLTTNQPQPGE